MPFVRAISVAFDMTFANRNRGGTQVYARSLFSALREKDGVSAWVISGPRASGIAGTMNWLIRGARRELNAKTPNLLHCPSFVAPWRVSLPLVVTVHDAAGRRFPLDHPLEWRFYDRRLMPSRLRAAARVITGSEFARREVISVYGLEADRVVAVPYGLDPRYLTAAEATPDNANGPMLFPGAPIGRKNLGAVLRVMAGTPALQGSTLEISGAEARDFPKYVHMIAELGLQSRVRWLGHAADMQAVLARSSVVVYPSLYEGFGFPPLEAMALGTPVVASDRGSLPEVLGDGALLVDPEDDRAVADAIEAVLTRPEMRERLRRAGRVRARTFTWEKCAARTLDVYRVVLNERRVAA